MRSLRRQLTGLGALAVLILLCLLAPASPSQGGNTSPTTSARGGASHQMLKLTLPLWPGFTIHSAPKTPTRPTHPRPIKTGPTGKGPAASHSRKHVVVPNIEPSPPGIAWTEKCFKEFGFCEKFPHVIGSKGYFEIHPEYTSGTSISGYLNNFTGDVWLRDSGKGYCVAEFTANCNPQGTFDTFYFVEVIHSKYSYYPWKALTAINGGVVKPKMTWFRGHLTCKFDRGIYGGPGRVIWANGLVYYLEAGNLPFQPAPPAILDRFFAGLRFTSLSRP